MTTSYSYGQRIRLSPFEHLEALYWFPSRGGKHWLVIYPPQEDPYPLLVYPSRIHTLYPIERYLMPYWARAKPRYRLVDRAINAQKGYLLKKIA